MKKIIGAALCLLASPVMSNAQTPTRPEILVLGTFHMANPGRDIHNERVDDMLAPGRQKEIAELVDVLRKFHPTKIAVEYDVTGSRVKNEYADYLAGNYTLKPNEIDQIGYRLAKELGLPTVYGINEDGDFPFYRVRNYAIANGMKAKFDSLQTAVGVRVKRDNEYLSTHSVLQALELMNSDSSSAQGVSEYYSGFMPFGEPYEYAGPDLVASWFQRNLRIYHNARALITSPNDRILVIYGAGHLGWLREIAEGDATVRLRKLDDFAAPRR